MTSAHFSPGGRAARALAVLTLVLGAGCSSEPAHCIHYDTARIALQEANALEIRYGLDVGAWPADARNDLDRWLDAYLDAASRMWANAPTDSAWAQEQPTLDDILDPAWLERGEETCD